MTATRRWLKYIDDASYVAFEFTARPMTPNDRDGSDVADHFHPEYVRRAEAGEPVELTITNRDQSYPRAAREFCA